MLMKFSIMAAAAGLLVSAPQAPAVASVEASAHVFAVARCIVQTNRPTAALLMMSLPIGGEPAHPSAMRTVAEAGCGADAVAADQSMLLRGGLAQALFLNDFVEFGIEPRNPRGLIDLGLPAETDPPSDLNRDLYRWSDCVVRNDTENVQRLFRSPVASRQEAQVMEVLQPYMEACARPMARLVVEASELRSLFAQSAYQALYRYWAGRLREANALSTASADQVVCRVSPETASRVRQRRICLSRAEWVTVENGIRDGLIEAQRRWTAGAGR